MSESASEPIQPGGEVDYLDLEDLLRLTRDLEAGPVRDIGLLDSAVARVRSRAFGVDAYPDPGLKVSALLHSLVRSHALVDGNKRLAWLATVVFLDINQDVTDVDGEGAFGLVMRVAGGLDDLKEIARRLRVTPL